MTQESAFLKKVYGLKENPFTGHSGVGPVDYFVGREKQRETWIKAVKGRKSGRGSSLNFIVGDYGYGKTFTLYTILEQYKDDPEILGVYIKLLREDLTPRFGADFVQRIFASINPDDIDKTRAKRALQQIPELLQLHASILSKWIDGDELARLFLSGRESLKAADLVKLGLRQSIKSTDVAKEYLIAFLYALRESGKPILLVCVDEVEYLFSQMRGAKVANVINALRDIYDLPNSPEVAKLGLGIANILFFFGISQAGWTNLNDLERREQAQGGPIQALFSRRRAIIELGPLSRDETELLIERRLRYNRAEKRFEKEPLIPYTKDFAEYVYELTLGNPREVVERCDYTLEDGLEQRVSKLTRAFAKTVFESHSLTTEPDRSTTVESSRTRSRRKRTTKG